MATKWTSRTCPFQLPQPPPLVGNRRRSARYPRGHLHPSNLSSRVCDWQMYRGSSGGRTLGIYSVDRLTRRSDMTGWQRRRPGAICRDGTGDAHRGISPHPAVTVRLQDACIRPSEIALRLGIGRASVCRVLGGGAGGDRQETARTVVVALLSVSGSIEVEDAADQEPNQPGEDDAHGDAGSGSQIVLPKHLLIAGRMSFTTQQWYQRWAYILHAPCTTALHPRWRRVQHGDFFRFIRHVIPPSHYRIGGWGGGMYGVFVTPGAWRIDVDQLAVRPGAGVLCAEWQCRW
jgi:hypothetical protein